MEDWRVFPDAPLRGTGPYARAFLGLGAATFHEACRIVKELPYGHPSDPNDRLILFRERRGTCTTKHDAVVALARELTLPVEKRLGLYAMTEELVTGAGAIIAKHGVPYIPMLHCFLASGAHRVDLTEGNRNGKNRPLEQFLVTATVAPYLGGKEEYRWYRAALRDVVLLRPEWRGVDFVRALRAREEGVVLLRTRVQAA